MKKMMIILALFLFVLPLAVAGCGQKEEAAQEAATEAVDAVKTHDCDGGCGMKDVPMDKLTEVHGKYYCAGCAKKAEEDHGHDHG